MQFSHLQSHARMNIVRLACCILPRQLLLKGSSWAVMAVLLVLILLLLVAAATRWLTRASAIKTFKKQLLAAQARLAAWETVHAQQAQTGTAPGTTAPVVESFTMGWANILLSALWVPVLEKQVSVLTAERLQLLLNELLSKNKHRKPWSYISKLTVEQVTFGYVPPRFQHCLVQYDPASKRVQLSMDAHFKSTGLQAVLLANVAQLGPLQPFSLRLQVTRVELSGRLLLGLNMCTEPPGIKSLEYSFASSPHFDLHAVPVGGWAAGLANSGLATELPAILVSNLRTAILRAMNRRIVAPYKKAIDIVKIWKNKHVAKVGGAGGVLCVVVVSARELLPDAAASITSANGRQRRHSSVIASEEASAAVQAATRHSHADHPGGSTTATSADVYVELHYGREVFRTPIVHAQHSSGNPVWNWQFDIKLRAPLPTKPAAAADLTSSAQAVQDAWPPQVPAVLNLRVMQAQALQEPQLLSEACVQLATLALQPNTPPVPVNVPLNVSSAAARRYASVPGGSPQLQPATHGTLHLTCCWQQVTPKKDPFAMEDIITQHAVTMQPSQAAVAQKPFVPRSSDEGGVMWHTPSAAGSTVASRPATAQRAHTQLLSIRRATGYAAGVAKGGIGLLLHPLLSASQRALLLLAAKWRYRGHLLTRRIKWPRIISSYVSTQLASSAACAHDREDQQLRAAVDVFIASPGIKAVCDDLDVQQGHQQVNVISPSQHMNLHNATVAASPDTQGHQQIASPTVETPKPAAPPPRPSSAGVVYSSPGAPAIMPAGLTGLGFSGAIMPATPTQTVALQKSHHSSFSSLVAVLRGHHNGAVPGNATLVADTTASHYVTQTGAHQHGAGNSTRPQGECNSLQEGAGAATANLPVRNSQQARALHVPIVEASDHTANQQEDSTSHAAVHTTSSSAVVNTEAASSTALDHASDTQAVSWNSRRRTYPTLDPLPSPAAAVRMTPVRGNFATPSLNTWANTDVNPLQTLAQTLHMQGLLDDERANCAALQQQLSELQHRLGALQRIWRAEGRRALLEGASFLWHQQPSTNARAPVAARAVILCLLDGCAVIRVIMHGMKKDDSALVAQVDQQPQAQRRGTRVLRRSRSSGRSHPTTLWSPGQPLLPPLYIPLDCMQSVQLGSHLFPTVPTTEGWAGIKAMLLSTRLPSTAGVDGAQQARSSSVSASSSSYRDDATCLSVVLRGGAALHLQLPPQGNGRSRDEWARALQDLLPT